VARSDDARLWPQTAAAIAAMHLGYGVGMLEGAVAQIRARTGFGALPDSVRPR